MSILAKQEDELGKIVWFVNQDVHATASWIISEPHLVALHRALAAHQQKLNRTKRWRMSLSLMSVVVGLPCVFGASIMISSGDAMAVGRALQIFGFLVMVISGAVTLMPDRILPWPDDTTVHSLAEQALPIFHDALSPAQVIWVLRRYRPAIDLALKAEGATVKIVEGVA